MSNKTTVTITLDVTPAQRIAVEDMLACWNSLAGVGSSRWTAFYADGDGDFKPNATIDGKKPTHTLLLPPDAKWRENEYRMDYDMIGWKLYSTEIIK